MCAHANQNAHCMNQRYMYAVCVNHDAHGGRLTSRVYTFVLDVHFISLMCCTHADYVVSIFRNLSCHIVATCMCSQV